jgi:hypothetical protein
VRHARCHCEHSPQNSSCHLRAASAGTAAAVIFEQMRRRYDPRVRAFARNPISEILERGKVIYPCWKEASKASVSTRAKDHHRTFGLHAREADRRWRARQRQAQGPGARHGRMCLWSQWPRLRARDDRGESLCGPACGHVGCALAPRTRERAGGMGMFVCAFMYVCMCVRTYVRICILCVRARVYVQSPRTGRGSLQPRASAHRKTPAIHMPLPCCC